ncbi:endonuclease YncB(thermonuclease family) [Bradyrhizobium sp. USDA 4454]
MVLPKAEEEWGQRASAFLKAEMKKADVTCWSSG